MRVAPSGGPSRGGPGVTYASNGRRLGGRFRCPGRVWRWSAVDPNDPTTATTAGTPDMTRTLSGIKPTGHLTLGNYLGALRRWVAEDQHRTEALFFVADLHALTMDHDPARVRRLS